MSTQKNPGSIPAKLKSMKLVENLPKCMEARVILKMAVFCNAVPCSLGRYWPTFQMSLLPPSSWRYIYQTTWHNIPEDSHLHTCCCDNLKSHPVILYSCISIQFLHSLGKSITRLWHNSWHFLQCAQLKKILSIYMPYARILFICADLMFYSFPGNSCSVWQAQKF
jgi:hypothetical protein